VVRLPAGGYGTTEFDMSDERRTALVDAGRSAMRAYFDNSPVARPVPRSLEAPDPRRVKPIADRIATRLLSQ